jgi:hypothetical protein
MTVLILWVKTLVMNVTFEGKILSRKLVKIIYSLGQPSVVKWNFIRKIKRVLPVEIDYPYITRTLKSNYQKEPQ